MIVNKSKILEQHIHEWADGGDGGERYEESKKDDDDDRRRHPPQFIFPKILTKFF